MLPHVGKPKKWRIDSAWGAMASPPAIEDQARLLDDAKLMVRQQSQMMRKCLETPGKLMDAL